MSGGAGGATSYDPDARARALAAVVRRLVAAIAADDLELVATLLTDDVVYHVPGQNRLAGTYRGKAEVLAFLGERATALDEPLEVDVHDVMASEAHGADLSTITARRAGRVRSWRTVSIYHFVEDRVSEVFVTIEDPAGVDAFLSD